MKKYEIRAQYSDTTVRVYQAYSPEIAKPALAAGRFVPPFKMARMTWIKPSFNWMMYRSGYGSKPGQEAVLAIEIKRDGFEWVLEHAALSSFHPGFHKSHEQWKHQLGSASVRVQWDPERDWRLNVVPDVRSIQIGLSAEAVERYVNHWIVGIEDITSLARSISAAVRKDSRPSALPSDLERPYPVDLNRCINVFPQSMA